MFSVVHSPGSKSLKVESFWSTMKIRLDGFKDLFPQYPPVSLSPGLTLSLVYNLNITTTLLGMIIHYTLWAYIQYSFKYLKIGT